MAQLTIPFEEVDKLTDRGEVDTLTLFVNMKKLIKECRLDYSYMMYCIKKVSKKERKCKYCIIIDGKKVSYNDDYYNSRIVNPRSGLTRYSFSYREYTGYLKITLVHSEVLGQNDESIIENLKEEMAKHFDIETWCLDDLEKYVCLGRIDYKRDYYFHDQEEYYLIKQIIEIAPENIQSSRYLKNKKEDSKKAYLLKYQSEANKTVEFVIYDKYKERIDDFNKKQIDICSISEYTEDYKNIIRFEVRIKNAKLNAIKNKIGIAKDITNYKTKDMAEMLFNNYSEQAFFTEPIYRKDIAKRLINKSNLSKSMKAKCCSLIEMINKKGYTYAKNKYSTVVLNKGKQVRRYNKFNNYIENIRGLGINPLTLKMRWKDYKGKFHKTTYKIIKNFTLAENCLKEEALMPFNLENIKKKGKDYHDKL